MRARTALSRQLHTDPGDAQMILSQPDGIEITPLTPYKDDRGWNSRPLDEALLAAGHYKSIHIVTIAPGTIRGNHSHHTLHEWTMIIGGPCLFAAKNPSGDIFKRIFDVNEHCLIHVPPKSAHAFKNISDDMIYLLCAADEPFDPTFSDTSPCRILD